MSTFGALLKSWRVGDAFAFSFSQLVIFETVGQFYCCVLEHYSCEQILTVSENINDLEVDYY